MLSILESGSTGARVKGWKKQDQTEPPDSGTRKSHIFPFCPIPVSSPGRIKAKSPVVHAEKGKIQDSRPILSHSVPPLNFTPLKHLFFVCPDGPRGFGPGLSTWRSSHINRTDVPIVQSLNRPRQSSNVTRISECVCPAARHPSPFHSGQAGVIIRVCRNPTGE